MQAGVQVPRSGDITLGSGHLVSATLFRMATDSTTTFSRFYYRGTRRCIRTENHRWWSMAKDTLSQVRWRAPRLPGSGRKPLQSNACCECRAVGQPAETDLLSLDYTADPISA